MKENQENRPTVKSALNTLLGFSPPFVSRNISRLVGDCPYMMSDKMLPDADCDNCEFMDLPHQKSHCYMFLDKPEDNKCGQFKRKA